MDQVRKFPVPLYMVGLGLMLVGWNLSLRADCQVLEVVVVKTLFQAAHGIGLCEATFTYHPHSLAGTMITSCPTDMDNHPDVAVCYAVARPHKYKVALLASDLTVMRRRVPLGLLIAGSTLLACTMLAHVLVEVLIQRAATRRNHDGMPLLPNAATGQPVL